METRSVTGPEVVSCEGGQQRGRSPLVASWRRMGARSQGHSRERSDKAWKTRNPSERLASRLGAEPACRSVIGWLRSGGGLEPCRPLHQALGVAAADVAALAAEVQEVARPWRIRRELLPASVARQVEHPQVGDRAPRVPRSVPVAEDDRPVGKGVVECAALIARHVIEVGTGHAQPRGRAEFDA